MLRIKFLDVTTQHADYFAEREQAFVNVSCFLHHELPLALGLLQALAASQVHKGNLAILLIYEAVILILGLRYQVHGQDAVQVK